VYSHVKLLSTLVSTLHLNTFKNLMCPNHLHIPVNYLSFWSTAFFYIYFYFIYYVLFFIMSITPISFTSTRTSQPSRYMPGNQSETQDPHKFALKEVRHCFIRSSTCASDALLIWKETPPPHFHPRPCHSRSQLHLSFYWLPN